MENLEHLHNNLIDTPVTYGEIIFKPEIISTKTFGEIVDLMKYDLELKASIMKIRTATNTNEEAKKEMKTKLPYFSFASFDGKRSAEFFHSTQFLIFDFDHLDELDLVRNTLEKWKYTSAVFTSPSGNGLKLVIKLNVPIILFDKYTEVYKNICAKIETKFRIQIDTQTCDPARACFLSHDESIFLNANAEDYDINSEAVDEHKISASSISKRPATLEAFKGVPEGMRHGALTKVIGLYINKGFDKEFTKKAAFGINQLNQPPFTAEEFDKEFESIHDSFTKEKSETAIPFYTLIESKTGVRVQINPSKLIDFLSADGFSKIRLSESNYVFVRVVRHVLKLVSIVEVKDFLEEYIGASSDPYKEMVRDTLIKSCKTLLAEEALHFLPTIIPKIKRGTKDHSYLFFNNVYVEITPDIIRVQDYTSLNGETIWQDSIIQKDIDADCFLKDETSSEYERMLFNICREKTDWFNALTCALGYVAHDYKDKANAKAIIFCDEEIPAADDSNGGTGKSLVCEGLKYIRKSAIVDGKNFKTDSSFIFQNINVNTELVVLDDARKTFDFESLLSVITSDLTIEKKHRDPFTIPFDRSPKFIITTNYTIKGNGNSFDRRRHEIEFSNFYNKNFSPKDEFGHRLFDEWDNTQWTGFYKSMAQFIQKYLQKGLVKYEVRNLKTRHVIDSTCQEFLDWVQNYVMVDQEYHKKHLLEKFKDQFPEYSMLKSKTFTRWLKVYADSYDLHMGERRADADRKIKFTSNLLSNTSGNGAAKTVLTSEEEELEAM